MKLVFLSCYLNHHLRPVSDALSRMCDYAFIATTAGRSDERRALGWVREQEPAYVVHYDREPERVKQLLQEADVIFTGAAPEKLVRSCIQRNQLVLRYAERPLKKGPQWKKYLPRLIKWHYQNPAWRKVYMLCASAYTAGDYARFGLFRGRCFRWGYFPAFVPCEDPQKRLREKKPNSILWVGRFLDWKHPDDALEVAHRLNLAGYDYTLDFIGIGPMEQKLRQLTEEKQLQHRVRFLGAMPPDRVRSHMEEAEILLFTSDRQEGWGAVLNEAMNSLCCPVADSRAGSVPFLIRHGENGLMYAGDVNVLYEKVAVLLEHPEQRRNMGLCAYETIRQQWNPEEAARRLLTLAQGLLRGEKSSPFDRGPCSSAEEKA